MEEIWRDIYYFNESTNEWIDYRGIYQVSNLGRIRSLDRYVRGYNHGIEHKKYIKGCILKLRTNCCGYWMVHFSKNGKHRDYSLHRIVYFSFNPNADTTLEVNHIDENKDNCTLSNLNLLSPKDNCNYGTRNQRIASKTKGAIRGKMSEENRKRISTALKQSAKAKEGRKITALKNSKSIVCLTDNGTIVKEYTSAAEAERETGIASQSINDCCRHKNHRLHAGGYKWEYKRG